VPLWHSGLFTTPRRRPTRSSLPRALVLIGLGALTGCGAASTATPSTSAAQRASAAPTPTPTPAAIDPCQLVTLSDAQTFAQVTMSQSYDNNETCMYDSPPTGPTVHVETHVGAGAKQIYDDDRRIGHTFTSLPGIGDEAYEEPNAAFLRKGTVWVSITVVALDLDTRTVQTGLKTLATNAAGLVPSGQ
jgi:hypothetical protein